MLTGGHCSEVGFCNKDSNWDSRMIGRSRQVVVSSGLTLPSFIMLFSIFSDTNVLVAPFEFLAANNIPAKDSVKQNTFYAADWIFTSGKKLSDPALF
jgi:hypothetical protein